MENEKGTHSMSKDMAETNDISDFAAKSLPKFGVRHIQVVFLFFCLFIGYALRVNLSVGIVAMTDKSNTDYETYDWSEATRGLILSSFFWGYFVSQVPAGMLAQRYGPKILLLLSTLLCSILTIVTPVVASLGWEYLCAVRVLQGLAQGFLYPSVHTLLSKWIHLSERGFLTAFAYSGTTIGTVVMMAISGVLADSSMGWPSIFYFSGSVGFIWTIIWFFYGSNSPQIHKTISKLEKNFIETTPGSSTHRETTYPWKDIFTSKPFVALIITHCTQNWGFWTLLTEMPTYMNEVLHFDIKANGILSALPYLVMFILIIIISKMSDFLISREYVSVGWARKICNTIGHWLPMFCLIGLGYVYDDSVLAVSLLTLAVGCNAGANCGYMINHMDLSPNFAGTLMGITNCLANIMSILGPLFVGLIVNDPTDPTEWRIVFFVTSGFFFAGNLIFIVFGSGEIQHWNEKGDSKKYMTTSTITAETVDIGDLQKSK